MIDNEQAVRWSNERDRPMADLIARFFYKMERFLDDRAAQGVAAAMTPIGDTVAGSGSSGRTPVTGQDSADLAALLTTLRNAFRANSNQRLNTVLKVAVHPDE